MSKVCQVTGKRPMSGNNVSHANNKTRRRFLPNLQKKRYFLESENRWIRLKVTARGIKTISKNGIEAEVRKMRARGEKIYRQNAKNKTEKHRIGILLLHDQKQSKHSATVGI